MGILLFLHCYCFFDQSLYKCTWYPFYYHPHLGDNFYFYIFIYSVFEKTPAHNRHSLMTHTKETHLHLDFTNIYFPSSRNHIFLTKCYTSAQKIQSMQVNLLHDSRLVQDPVMILISDAAKKSIMNEQ